MMATEEREGLPATDALRVDAIYCQAASIDWSEAYGDDGDGWQSWEPVRCDECGRVHVLTANEEAECTGLDDDEREELDELRALGVGQSSDDIRRRRELAERDHDAAMLYADGPMMNYWYPLDGLEGEQAAELDGTNLAIVEVNGETGLALTGGGMDFSWEICEAFMRLGYYPPLRFAQLPRMADRPPLASAETYTAPYLARSRWILEGCRRSGEIGARWAQNVVDACDSMLNT